MITTLRTDSDHVDFVQLVAKLDQDLAIRDGDEHSFYTQYNKIDKIKHVVIAFENGIPLACGAIKEFDDEKMEVKRMYSTPESRGKGIASVILAELEKWTKELTYSKCILETGKKQPEAIRLYQKNGYRQIPNYGQYAEVENSVCFEKQLID